MRALLDALRDNQAAEHEVYEMQFFMRSAYLHLKILDPEHGEEELVKSMEVATAKLLRK